MYNYFGGGVVGTRSIVEYAGDGLVTTQLDYENQVTNQTSNPDRQTWGSSVTESRFTRAA